MNLIARCLLAVSVATAFAAHASEPVASASAPPAPSAAPTAQPAVPPAQPAAKPAYDAELARRYGADERGMRQYVLVVLKSGPTPVTDPDKRKAMFAGHFANMERLTKEGKLVLAGPFGKNEDGWRGLFVFAVSDIEEARKLVATDPVVINGEMAPELHAWYGTAAVMAIPDIYPKLEPPKPATP
jgi:uncharacterized protein YciI